VAALRRHAKKEKIPFFAVSAVTGEGLKPLLNFLGDQVVGVITEEKVTASAEAATA